jgi:hypothetical protein
MGNKGFLAIWCDIRAEDLSDYRQWIIKEHIADRIFSPGFLGARFCTDIADEKSHFFLYATEDKHVFQNPPYLHILNNPSPWTSRIMPKFGPFDRALGEQLLKLGNGFGAFMMVARIRDASDADLESLPITLARFMTMPDVVTVRLMKLDRSATDIKSREKTMRKGAEGDFHYLLVVEALSDSGALNAQRHLNEILAISFPEAEKSDSSVRKVIYGETPFEGRTLQRLRPPIATNKTIAAE